MDREYEVLEYISSSDEVTQREISEHLGISLGSVNLLLKKMIKEGLIKIEKIPANRVAYMLTPKGIQEKIIKTVSYIKIHYKAIEGHKDNIRRFLNQINAKGKTLNVCIYEPELRDMFINVCNENGETKTNMLSELRDDDLNDSEIYITDFKFNEIEYKNVYNIKKII